ncbi:DEAD/DEAH box helicase family protein [Anoxybacillus flavithermus]|uniref:Predicted type III restriction-modification enzyme, helicase subunit fused to restriction endonuclease-like domain n=1 Tax=Anoxybacillus flavithermus (strain DSM 21510 / WK1) TaxID=491915 RepID=B7GJA3_ANOFW|nr:DEAD/DEAH box helicase family protein [Anoxybacillus flavithermus]ACJ33551.1 Predicted type III restriction-modification enzyme, helicase subunit fused to restriction endonuclease-like domain [Anoxybacillus flavithermus WK1]
MSKKRTQQVDFAFYEALRYFYLENKKDIRAEYKNLSKKFLDFNSPENPQSFLRVPQFEALEMYVFLKEYLHNAKVHDIFEDWYYEKNKFAKRTSPFIAAEEQISFRFLDEKAYKSVFENMKQFAEEKFANYIFALTMGTGKTILMATCIFYEFLLAKKYPNDPLYCHNALVFAPDKTVLESLREIQTFDKRKVVPPEYVSWLEANLKVHFLEDTGTSLNIIENSKYNLIISNTQKIILKKQHKEKTPVDTLFSSLDLQGVYEEFKDIYIENDTDLMTNQRFEKLKRIGQLGIYVDEAHHAFGNELAKDMGVKKSQTSLRLTINELAKSLEEAGTRVVACYNYTGTPYIGSQLLPEVVYAYGLREAINNKYLKKVILHSYSNPKEIEYVRLVLKDFFDRYKDQRFEGMLPKIAFFGSTVDEVKNQLEPIVRQVLNELNIPESVLLINVGDPKITTNDDIREFNLLDTPSSTKQVILLVNKGREGWNCRSLFAVAMYRKPKSKIFVLQATMRCLRAIGPNQETASVYLSEENKQILEEELQQNFRIGTKDLSGQDDGKKLYQVKVRPPKVKIPIKRIRRSYTLERREITDKIDFEFENMNMEKYQLMHTVQEGLVSQFSRTEDLTDLRDKRTYSLYTLVAEVARYLNESCIKIEKILKNAKQSTDEILSYVNKYNEIIYDRIIPYLFNAMYNLNPEIITEKVELELVKEPKEGCYYIRAKEDLVIKEEGAKYTSKTFHLDTYCFDSKPEKILFTDLVNHKDVQEIYFTGMLTHGQTEFAIDYIDPESNLVRKYYPDFLIKKKDGTWLIVEVKGDNKIDDPLVEAKRLAAIEMAGASQMDYHIVKGTDVERHHYPFITKDSDATYKY